MKLVIALLLSLIPSASYADAIQVTSLETGKPYVAPVIEVSNGCNMSDVEEYYGRKAINDDHAKILCEMYKAAIYYQEPAYQVSESNPTPTPKMKPSLGMSKGDIKMSTWGSPESKTVRETVYSVIELWHYDRGIIMFENEQVVSITKYE